METPVFRIRSYGYQELASLYNPLILPRSAGKRLKLWIDKNETLKKELEISGWTSGSRILTPLQVEIIVRYLGEP